MGAVVIGDITNLICSINKENICGVSYAIESLFILYIVCYNNKRKREIFIF